MKNLFLYSISPKLLLLVLLSVTLFDNNVNAQYSVNFEGVGETKTAYASGNVTLSGLSWNMTEALIGTDVSDFKNGARSARMRGYSTSVISMNANVSSAGTISFVYRRYGTDGQIEWVVESSINDGGSWNQVGTAFTAPATDDVQTFSSAVNYNGNIRFRIRANGGNTSTNRRMNIDDILITAYSAGNTITTNDPNATTYSVTCTDGSNGSISFTSTGTFNAGNTFVAQLSDATGSFASPTEIGSNSISGVDPSGTINFTIPAGTASGSAYQIRIVSSDPSIIGTSSMAFTIDLTNGPCIEVTSLPSSGILINEFSNGPSGSQEYYEFIVAGECGSSIDIRGYIIDDNNGTFGFGTGMGIAPGYLRLTNHTQWESIPVGSLIVVYNNAERNASLPADDPYDSDNDSLYVIPHDFSALFELTTTRPTDTDSTYFPATYGSTSWSPLGIANSGDAIQVRSPDGSYWYGVSYGTALTGGPDNMKIYNGSMAGMCGWFSSGDIYDISNWSTGNVAGNETPGLPNNAENLAWLRIMRDPMSEFCPITVLQTDLIHFTGEFLETSVKLDWSTLTEVNVSHFEIYHSSDGKIYSKIGEHEAIGNSQTEQNYTLYHRHPSSGVNYYKLYDQDIYGAKKLKKVIAVHANFDFIIYNSHEEMLFLPESTDLEIYSVDGKLVGKHYNVKTLPFKEKGVFIVRDTKRNMQQRILAY